MNKKTKELVMAAILTALSLIITFSPVKLDLVFFTLTLGAHVPTLIAMFISPWVALMTVIGSCIGFFMVTNPVVVARAAVHIIFVLAGIKMIRSGKANPFIVILVTAVLHALAEGVAVYFLTPIILPQNATPILTAAGIAIAGTFIHHIIDCAICVPIVAALDKAKILHLPQNFKFRRAK